MLREKINVAKTENSDFFFRGNFPPTAAKLQAQGYFEFRGSFSPWLHDFSRPTGDLYYTISMVPASNFAPWDQYLH